MNSKRSTTRPPLAGDVTTAAPRVESTGASIFAGASSTSVPGGEFSNSQRDQNRATIIINLGGSDLDSSRATSAVSLTGTLGSARDSPDASTSSTSDEEQGSILEESSVFTDSGLGSSETSFEVESPPTEEEENALEEEPSNAIYERHMCLKKHGFPLWIPQPNMTLPRSYQRQGVSIGDVGIFTLDGGFDFLFNICLPAGHPSNPHELPEGFSRLDLNLADVCKSRAHSSQSYMSSPSVQKQSKAMAFRCSGSDGAILIMPQGAYHEDLRNIKRFRDYASLHAESWYQYANGHCGREIGNAELHLVTGCDKTTSWGIATYLHRQSKSAEDNVTQLSFSVSNEGRHSYPTFAWDQEGDAEVKACPEHEEVMVLPEAHALAPLLNQCTFVRSLTPALCDDDWERLQSKVAASAEARASPGRSPKNTFVSVLGAISSLPGRIGFLGGHSRVGTSRLTDSLTPARTLTAHPATFVVDLLLQKCPKAKVVVVHDGDWCSVIRDSDNDWMSTYQDLQHRIQEAFDIVEEENGTIYLQEKLGSSQQPSTSSHVSVTLEGEDFPLFRGREPGFSQPFDSFEISPSDVNADSLDTSEALHESQTCRDSAVNHFDHGWHLAQNSNPVGFEDDRDMLVTSSSKAYNARIQSMMSSAFANSPPSWTRQAGNSASNEALNETYQAPINQDDRTKRHSRGVAAGPARQVKRHIVPHHPVGSSSATRPATAPPSNPLKRKEPSEDNPNTTPNILPAGAIMIFPEEYETDCVVCEFCGTAVYFRDEETGEFSLKPWNAHRNSCSAAPGPPSGTAPSLDSTVIYTPESMAEALVHSPAKRRRVKRTEEDRIDYLRADPYVAQFEAYRVLCASCDKWIRLRSNSTYCSIPWDVHRKSCLAKKINVYALEERNNLFSKDLGIRKFDAERALCDLCDKWIGMPPDDHQQASEKWLQHRESCKQASTSPTVSRGTIASPMIQPEPSAPHVPGPSSTHRTPTSSTISPLSPKRTAPTTRSPSTHPLSFQPKHSTFSKSHGPPNSPPFHNLTQSNYAPAHKSRRNAEQRAATLRSDILISEVEPNRLFCSLCEKWVQLRQDSSYRAYPWLQHRGKCLARHLSRQQKAAEIASVKARAAMQSASASQSANGDDDEMTVSEDDQARSDPESEDGMVGESKNVYALKEGNNLFSKDPDIRNFDAERVHCDLCDKWVSVPPDDHQQASEKWLQHRESCKQASNSPTVSRGTIASHDSTRMLPKKWLLPRRCEEKIRTTGLPSRFDDQA